MSRATPSVREAARAKSNPAAAAGSLMRTAGVHLAARRGARDESSRTNEATPACLSIHSRGCSRTGLRSARGEWDLPQPPRKWCLLSVAVANVEVIAVRRVVRVAPGHDDAVAPGIAVAGVRAVGVGDGERGAGLELGEPPVAAVEL